MLKRLLAAIGILFALAFIAVTGVRLAAKSRGVATITIPPDSFVARRVSQFDDRQAFRITVESDRFRTVEAVATQAGERGKLIEQSPGSVVYRTVDPGFERTVEYRLEKPDDPERHENWVTVIESTRCTTTTACWRLRALRSYDHAQAAYRVSKMAGIRKTPGMG